MSNKHWRDNLTVDKSVSTLQRDKTHALVTIEECQRQDQIKKTETKYWSPDPDSDNDLGHPGHASSCMQRQEAWEAAVEGGRVGGGGRGEGGGEGGRGLAAQIAPFRKMVAAAAPLRDNQSGTDKLNTTDHPVHSPPLIYWDNQQYSLLPQTASTNQNPKDKRLTQRTWMTVKTSVIKVFLPSTKNCLHAT